MLRFKKFTEDKDNEINELKWNISSLKLQKATLSNEQVTQRLLLVCKKKINL